MGEEVGEQGFPNGGLRVVKQLAEGVLEVGAEPVFFHAQSKAWKAEARQSVFAVEQKSLDGKAFVSGARGRTENVALSRLVKGIVP